MTIKNGPMSKQLVLYPSTQPLLKHDLPLWLEEGDEDEVYSAPLCTVEPTRGGPQIEEDLIKDLIQNPPPSALSLEELGNDEDVWICSRSGREMLYKNMEIRVR